MIRLCHYRAVIIYLLLSLAGCSTTGSSDPSSLNFRMPEGSKLVLNRDVSISASYSHANFQNGEQTPGVDEYTINCSLEQRDLGPGTIVPDSFLITNFSSSREWINQPHTMRFYKMIRLRSERQPGIMRMECGYWDGPMIGRPVTLTDIQQALGDIFTFEFATPAPAPAP